MSASLSETAQAHLALVTDVVTSCFGPMRPAEFDRFCADAKSRALVTDLAGSFPDAAFKVDWASADERRVVLGGRLIGTHTGWWRGIEPTGRRMEAGCMTTFTVVATRVVSMAALIDTYAVAEQLGAVPSRRADRQVAAVPEEKS